MTGPSIPNFLPSLSLPKTELTAILHPIAIHLYLYLIQKSHLTQAQKLLQLHRQDDLSPTFENDLAQLSHCTEPMHVAENELAIRFKENRYVVSLSSYAFELLVAFCQDAQLLLILRILNMYIDLRGKSNVYDHFSIKSVCILFYL